MRSDHPRSKRTVPDDPLRSAHSIANIQLFMLGFGEVLPRSPNEWFSGEGALHDLQ